MKIRAVAILIKDNKVLLIHRINEKEYYVYPGGGVEEGETIEQAVLRELLEETTIKAKINRLLYKQIYNDGSEQYFYLCEYIEGKPKLSDDSIEKERMLNKEFKEYYNPLWVDIDNLKDILVYPLEIRDLFLEDHKNNFVNPINVMNIKLTELRE